MQIVRTPHKTRGLEQLELLVCTHLNMSCAGSLRVTFVIRPL